MAKKKQRYGLRNDVTHEITCVMVGNLLQIQSQRKKLDHTWIELPKDFDPNTQLIDHSKNIRSK
tara:strand:- start:22 stop:213 length:192 start_codon:yes stop_codon:yes gene_type:complete